MAAGAVMVSQLSPLLPAEWTVTMPAARTASTTACSTSGAAQPSTGGHDQELLMTCGALDGSPSLNGSPPAG